MIFKNRRRGRFDPLLRHTKNTELHRTLLGVIGL